MYKTILLCLLMFRLFGLNGQNSEPFISIVSSVIDESTKVINLSYLIDDDDQSFEVIAVLYDEEGNKMEGFTVEGDVGPGVEGVGERSLTINYADLTTKYAELTVELVVDDGQEVDILSILDQVDKTRLEDNLIQIVGRRHNTSSPTHLIATRDFIEEEFKAEGLLVEKQAFNFRGFEGANIIGLHKGVKNSDEVMIIDAHFDSVSDSPGADDNGSGVVGMLEAARILSNYKFDKSIQFIGFDQEESGLVGSEYSVREMPSNYDVKGVINLEMIGFYSDEENSQALPSGFGFLFPEANDAVFFDDYRGNFIGNIANGTSSGLSDLFTSSALKYVEDLKVIPIIFADDQLSLVPDLARSDHAPYWIAGIPALFITDTGNFRNPNYHQPSDIVETIDYNFIGNIVKTVVATALDFAKNCHCGSDEVSFETSANENQEYKECEINIYGGYSETIVVSLGECGNDIISLNFSDVNGRILKTLSIDGGQEEQVEMDASNFNAGIYIVSAEFKDHSIQSKKIIVTK